MKNDVELDSFKKFCLTPDAEDELCSSENIRDVIGKMERDSLVDGLTKEERLEVARLYNELEYAEAATCFDHLEHMKLREWWTMNRPGNHRLKRLALRWQLKNRLDGLVYADEQKLHPERTENIQTEIARLSIELCNLDLSLGSER